MKDIFVVGDDGYNTDGSEGPEERNNHNELEHKVDFGILFDVDGVLARGSTPLSAAVEAFRYLQDEEGRLKVPVAFVTNACNRSQDKAAQIQTWLNIQITPDQVIHAPTPARLLTEFHDKHVLVVGQEYRVEIAKDIGFNNVCTVEDIQKAYPLLDMVDHKNRDAVAIGQHSEDPKFPPVEAILLIGEPTHWESHLQLLIDLLLTEGSPKAANAPTLLTTVKQLPIIACNMDLVFMHQACMPRFGHGAFLVCLEALYKKITGRELQYTALIGKPCEITYRYAEHVINDVARRLGISNPIKKLYFVGDNPNVDIVGANLYNRFLKHSYQNRMNDNLECPSAQLPLCRSIPAHLNLYNQTVLSMESLLVGTGVFKPDDTELPKEKDVYHGHRDILHEPELTKPSRFVQDVFYGIQYILEQETLKVKTIVH